MTEAEETILAMSGFVHMADVVDVSIWDWENPCICRRVEVRFRNNCPARYLNKRSASIIVGFEIYCRGEILDVKASLSPGGFDFFSEGCAFKEGDPIWVRVRDD